jgi:hypothetical protein
VLFVEQRIADRISGHEERPELLKDRDVEVAVDGRRRAERSVVRNAKRVLVRRCDQQRRARREHGIVERVDVVVTRANDPAQMLAEYDLVLKKRAPFVAILCGRRDVERESRPAITRAVGQDVARAEL